MAPLSKDPEQSFFRAWAVRSSESELTDSISPGSPVSPRTMFVQRKPKKLPHRRALSEAVDDFQKEQIPSQAYLSAIPSFTLEDTPNPKHTQAPDGDPPDSKDSRSSSISERALRLFRRGNVHKTHGPTMDLELPRKAKNTSKWRHEISGPWFEFRIGRRTVSENDEIHEWTNLESQLPELLNKDPMLAPNTKGARSVKSGSLSNAEEPRKKSTATDFNPTKGLYSRTKRRFSRKPIASDSDQSEHRTDSFTDDVLNRASSILKELSEGSRAPKVKAHSNKASSPSTSTSSHSITRWQSRASRLNPFHRRQGNSSSSSLRTLQMGDPPRPSPDLQSMYTGSDAKQYFSVEMTAPDGPAFLPSEAWEIKTPSLHNSTSYRPDFFGEQSAPDDDELLSPGPIAQILSQRQPNNQQRFGAEGYGSKQKLNKVEGGQSLFELNIPEHLPNSPLCPRNPKHPSRGKGICVYHGRNRMMPIEEKGDTSEGAEENP